jgi:hypothetical protein
MSAPLGPSPAQITIMGHNISARIVAAKARHRRQVRLTIAAGAVTVGVALTAAGIGVASAPPDVQAASFSCFSADDLRSTAAGVNALDGAVHEGAERVAAALAACDVVFGLDGIQTPDPTACELADLRIGVFPNVDEIEADEFCQVLGLGRPPLD